MAPGVDDTTPAPIERASTEGGNYIDKNDGGKITKVQGDVHFHETITAAPLDPWSKRSLQLYAILLVAALNATASGFDGVSLPRSTERPVVTTVRQGAN